jgi:DNA polymerase III subunit gamma/tau
VPIAYDGKRMSYYLTYRPQTVAELDLVQVREAFGRILSSGQFAHAYLLTGPKGTGKTSSARILAKVLNCEHNKTGVEHYRKTGEYPKKLLEPCGECEQCRAITRGSSLAVIEMDAASNRGIDDVRQLRERIGLAPATGAMTVYVIDEVHMLTTEAFNALLKTLEEPPRHAIFILCTTESHKIPDTINSRCTRISYSKASVDEVVGSLKKAITGEKLTVDDAVLTALAQRVDGSFRDGMKILEQLAQQGKTITLESLDEITGYSDEYDPALFYEAVLKREVTDALNQLVTKQEQGVDFGVFGKRVLEYMHEQMVQAITKNPDELVNTSKLLDHFYYYQTRYKKPVLESLPLEIATVLWCTDADQGSTPQDIIQEEQELPAEPNIQEDRKSKQPQVDFKASGNIKQTSAKKEGISKDTKSEQPEKPALATKPLNLDSVREAWPAIMRKVKPYNHSLEALLRASEPEQCEEEWLQLKVYYSFHKEQLEQERYRAILEEVMSKHLGSVVRLRFNLGEKAKQVIKTHPVDNNVSGEVDEKMAAAAEEIFG